MGRVSVGRVGKPHGVKGAFFVEEPSEHPERYARGAKLLAGEREVEIVESKVSGGRPVIRLDVEVPRGTTLELERESLPSPGEDTYYVFQLVGLDVVEEGGRTLGSVTNVAPGVANDVLELDSRMSLPMVEDCIREVDLERGRILVAPGYSDAG